MGDDKEKGLGTGIWNHWCSRYAFSSWDMSTVFIFTNEAESELE